MTARQLQRCLWTFASLYNQAAPLVFTLGRQYLESNLCNGKQASSLGNVAWCLAKTHMLNTELSDALVKHTYNRLQDLNDRCLSGVAWALATVRHQDDTLLIAVVGASHVILTQFSSQNLANLLWAIAVLKTPVGQPAA